jgi:hypothetical protein
VIKISGGTHEKAGLIGRIVWNNNLTKAQAKGLEQRLIDHFGGAKSTNPLTNLLNNIRSYSPWNANSKKYRNAASDELFQETLKRLGL